MMLMKESNGFDDARLGYQRLDPHRPEVIFAVTSAPEIEEAVKYAADHGKRVAVQASGHGLTRGNNGGVLIATGDFNGVRVDVEQKTAWIEAGATWRQVIDATAPYGLAPLSGSYPGVGAISYTLGGGTGLMARRYGFAADHVRRIEVVTADGVRRNAEDDPELFWALRGGGGNFGVVTGIEIELFEVPTLYGGSLYFDLTENPTVLEIWREWTRTVPDEVTSAIALIPFPDIPPVPAPLRGKHIAQIQVAILGDHGPDLIEPLKGEPVLDTVGVLPYSESARIFAEPDHPNSYRSRNVLLSDLDPDLLATLPKHASGPTMCVIGIRHLGGALSRPPSIPNAIGHRDATYSLTALSSGETDVSDLHRTILEPWAPTTIGRSLNFSFGPLTTDEVRAAFDPGDYDRLIELKNRYDPARLLAPNHPLEQP
jgi:hypothetical protein